MPSGSRRCSRMWSRGAGLRIVSFSSSNTFLPALFLRNLNNTPDKTADMCLGIVAKHSFCDASDHDPVQISRNCERSITG